VFLIVVVFCGFVIQFVHLSEMLNFKDGSEQYMSLVPVFTFMSVISSLAGAVLFGRPYGTLCVAFICLVISGAIFKMAPYLMGWWDRMSMLFGMLSLVIEFYYYVQKYERDD
jgi:hypothetical protein